MDKSTDIVAAIARFLNSTSTRHVGNEPLVVKVPPGCQMLLELT